MLIQQISKKNLLLLFLLVIGLSVFFACRKMDRSPNNKQSKDVTARFFSEHPSTYPHVKALADLMKKENEQTHFVNKIAQSVGFPYWNKALSYSPGSGSNARTGTDDSLNFYFIPFVRDTQNIVNACLIIKTRGSDTSYKWLCDWQYKDTAYTGVTRRATSAFLMQIDKEVFGQQRKYHVTDTALFDSRTSAVTVNGTSVLGASADNRSAVVEICITYQAPVNGWLSGCEPGSPCNPYQEVTQCTSITLADNPGGSNDINNGLGWVNTAPSGGGSTAGWTQPPANPCALLSTGGREPELPPGCTEPYGPGWVPVEDNDRDENGYLYTRIAQLQDSLAANPFALLPCDSLNITPFETYGYMYQRVAQFQPSQYILDRIDSIADVAYDPLLDGFGLQSLEFAYASVVNCDFFSVRITQLPSGFTARSLAEYFRTNINDFISPSVDVEFFPYCDINFCDTIRFYAPYENSLGALIHIEIPWNDGSVIESDYYSSFTSGNEKHRFKFSTMSTPQDLDHPVAGNREFGVYSDPSRPGEFVFYTMAVDRTSNIVNAIANSDFFGNNVFNGSDALWNDMQQNMINFVSSHGGQAQYYNPTTIIARPKYNDVEDFLRGIITYDQLKQRLGC